MKVDGKLLGPIGIFLFFIGLLLGMVILGIATMGDFEAYIFLPEVEGKSVLRTLNCPVVIDQSEVETVQVSLTNSTDNKITPAIWTHFSEGFVTILREERNNLTIQPGETQVVQWSISGDKATFGNWVLIKTYVYSQYPLPTSDASCGVFVADLKGLSGAQAYWFSVSASLVLMAIGVWIWAAKNRFKSTPATREWLRSFMILGGIVLIGLVTTTIGSHYVILNVGLLVVNVLAIITFLMRKLVSP